MDYSERYCAYIDILGFSELVARLRPGDESFATLRDVLQTVHSTPKPTEIEIFKEGCLRAQSISDAVCISTEPNVAGLSHLIYTVQELALKVLEQGYLKGICPGNK